MNVAENTPKPKGGQENRLVKTASGKETLPNCSGMQGR